jgi:hypothetical protein
MANTIRELPRSVNRWLDRGSFGSLELCE